MGVSVPEDARLAALATEPNARVMVLVDGQNLYKTCRELFGHPLCHPHLLAEHLAGPRTQNRIACRFYTGRPNQNVPGERIKVRNLDRRLDGMRGVGVTVVTRPLRYHWDWGHKEMLPRPHRWATPQTVTLKPSQRPQEKGIDLAIALDVIEFVLADKLDVAIVVSLDRDLSEIPKALRNLRPLVNRAVRLEAAVPVEANLRYPKTVDGFDYTHQITPGIFELVRDNTNYAAPKREWSAPAVPKSLSNWGRKR